MRLPLFVFPVWQSYGLSWNTKRGFHLLLIRVRPPTATRKENKPDSLTVKANKGMRIGEGHDRRRSAAENQEMVS